MPSYEASIAISAPREAVWRVLSDVVAWPDWLPTVSSVQALQGRSLEVGARYIVVQPKLRPTTWVVTEHSPPRRFTWQARSPSLLMVADHLVEASSPASAQVQLRFSFAGLLGLPVGWLFRSITKRYIAQEVLSLQHKVEANL
jgi:uncharacterized membrane protein